MTGSHLLVRLGRMMLALVLATAVAAPPEDPCGPSSNFTVRSQQLELLVGEKARLRLWVNRPRASLRFRWTLKSAPAGSASVIENSAGDTNLIGQQACEVAFSDAVVPVFTPDVAGRYEFEVDVMERTTGERSRAGGVFVARVGPPEGAGCAGVPGAPFMVLALMAWRRRRA